MDVFIPCRDDLGCHGSLADRGILFKGLNSSILPETKKHTVIKVEK